MQQVFVLSLQDEFHHLSPIPSIWVGGRVLVAPKIKTSNNSDTVVVLVVALLICILVHFDLFVALSICILVHFDLYGVLCSFVRSMVMLNLSCSLCCPLT